MEPTYTHCVVCGKPLEFPDRRPFILRTKKYCGKKCKSIAISARHRQKVRESRNPQEPVHTHCETCGKPLEFPNPTGAVLRTKRFCSRRCGEIARRKQKREAKLANAPPPNHNRCEICGKPLEFPDKRGHVLKKKRFCSKKPINDARNNIGKRIHCLNSRFALSAIRNSIVRKTKNQNIGQRCAFVAGFVSNVHTVESTNKKYARMARSIVPT